MSHRIRRLPDLVINQIAAGEVVERPASAVKEIIENAIDANAKRIDVRLTNGGLDGITIDDDGDGMFPDELVMAAERHATSKLPSDDVSQINYLGFRGEALPSIGAVSEMAITSCKNHSADGWRVSINEGRISKPVPSARQSGTRVEVRNLFKSIPVRLKFMKTPQTETRQCAEIIKRLAMAHPTIAFRLTEGEKTVTISECASPHCFRLWHK